MRYGRDNRRRPAVLGLLGSRQSDPKMRVRRKSWSPDKRGLIKAGVGVVAAVTHTALPLTAVADGVLSLVKGEESAGDAWHDRLVSAIQGWLEAHREIKDAVGELPSNWERSLLAELDRLDTPSLLGSDPGTRDVIIDVVARTVFTPLIATDRARQATLDAARRLVDDLPDLLVQAAAPDPGLSNALTVLKGDLADVLDRLDPKPADRTALEAYLTALVDEMNQDAWTRLAGGASGSSLTSIAQRLSATASAYSNRRRDDATVMVPVDDLVQHCERVVILGGPGAGKTWAARRSAIEAAAAALEALSNDADPATVEIPLFARCVAAFAISAATWEGVVEASLSQVTDRLGPGRVGRALERRFLEQPGRYLLLLDGLDEADHLPATNLLDRLVKGPRRELRIVLTSRPSSWRHQLPLDGKNDRHRVADLLPLRYPEDVEAVVNAWLGDEERATARNRLLVLMAQRPELAAAARTPLLCAMYCLLAESEEGLPATRLGLQRRLVTRLLRGTWRGDPSAVDQHLEPARAALRELARTGATDDPATGLAAWNETILDTVSGSLSERVVSAMSHVAPPAEYDPDTELMTRRFIHSSIREHVLAQDVSLLPVPDAASRLAAHLWYDPKWEFVVPAAIAGHRDRDQLLRALIGDTALDRRDGFGELRRLLVRLAIETSPSDWDGEHAALIDAACGRLASVVAGVSRLSCAANGWPAARPTASAVAMLERGEVPWPRSQTREWIRHLDLGPVERDRLRWSLVESVRARRTGPSGTWVTGEAIQPMFDLAVVLDALEPTQGQRDAAVSGLQADLGARLYADGALALRALGGSLGEDDLRNGAQAVIHMFGGSFAGYFAADLADAVDALDAAQAIQQEVADAVLDLMARLPRAEESVHEVESTVRAIRTLRPGLERVTRAAAELLNRLDHPSSSWQAGQLKSQLVALVPSDPSAGVVLARLLEHGGPGERTGHADDVLAWLAARSTEDQRRSSVAVVRRRLEAADGAQAALWAKHLASLEPTWEERRATVEHLLTRLASTPANRCGDVARAIRTLGADGDQRRRAIWHVANHLGQGGSAQLEMALCQILSWFGPEGEARTKVAAALIEAAGALDALSYPGWLSTVADALPVTDSERADLVDVVVSRIGAESLADARRLAEEIIRLQGADDQRARAADLLLTRLQGTPIGTLSRVVEVVRDLDPPTAWRPAAAELVVPALLAAELEDLAYASWADLLPDLAVTEEDRQLLAGTVLGHLDAERADKVDRILELFDTLSPTGSQAPVVARRIVCTSSGGIECRRSGRA